MLRRVAHAKTNASRSSLRLAAVGLALGVGLVVGASLIVLFEAPSNARELPPELRLDAGISGGCTTLALDRDKGHTEAEPCPRPAPQLAGTFQAPEAAANAY
jgi:hypothetical protein